ncbi:MAG: bifunctional adenosylcobinamide kinase/adenosylcobinamide-phosphate guanylyltransferase [Parvibaculaceae bacterium]|nr:bifunctional adenosylcobinamide kinase/adenosylcobinamide-phosphate guanylyltransferase [Parvibaculaceae bacterium]
MSLPRLTLVLGGARSGKSRFAEDMLAGEPAPWVYVATAQAFDSEMESRIGEHRARRGPDWRTLEAPLDLAGALRQAPGGAPVLVDCLTIWLTNLMLGEHDAEKAITAFEDALAARAAPVVLVSNEVGLGIVPDNELARRFRDEAGRLNQRMARQADRVVFMVSGLPMYVKGAP